MRLVDAEFEEKHYLSMLDNPTPDVSENDRKTALAIVRAFRLAGTVEERKTGKAIVKSTGYKGYWACDQCGAEIKCTDNFCPNCGAKMEGAES